MESNKTSPELRSPCKDARRHASEMLEAHPQLTLDQIKFLQLHYVRCTSCREFLNSLEAVVQTLRSLPTKDCPESVRQLLSRESGGSEP